MGEAVVTDKPVAGNTFVPSATTFKSDVLFHFLRPREIPLG